MNEENPSKPPKKPRIVRVVSDDTLEAWETQRAEYLAAHPGEALKPVKDELVREALGMPEEEIQETRKEEKEETEEEAAEKAQTEDAENEDEADAETEAEEESEEKEGKNEEPAKEESEESRVEAEKPEKKKPVIKMITEPVVKKEERAKPRLIESLEEQAARDVLPRSPQPGTPLTMAQPTLGEASKDVRVEEARRIWLQRQEEKKRNLGFFGKLKATLGFH